MIFGSRESDVISPEGTLSKKLEVPPEPASPFLLPSYSSRCSVLLILFMLSILPDMSAARVVY